jgi:hypothetical protein
MSYFRSYFEKNNTIVEKSTINTAKNPNTELYYGVGFSKFIFKVDFDELKRRVTDEEVIINSGTTHTLHLTNTIFGDESLMGGDRGNGKRRASSFDLILFKIDQYWDEGLGFEYEKNYDFGTGEALYDTRPSNWFNRTTLDAWSIEGIYQTGTTLVGTGNYGSGTTHFMLGNEDLDIDISDYVNDIILSGNTDYGLGVAFAIVYQDITLSEPQSVSFFTKYTQTFFEPYVDTYFDDHINDCRSNFIENVDQNLYLYVTKGSNPYDLDSLPTVDILGSSKDVIPELTGTTSTKIRQGVYEITFPLTGQTCDGKKFFYDKWKNLSIDGNSIPDITQKFIPKPFTSLYTLGENQTELQRYAIQFFGVRLNEKIKRGDKRKIVVTFRSINDPKTVLFDEVYYRIFIKEGKTNVNVFDWTKIDKTNENSFILDTSFMIPREYVMEIKAKTHSEEIFYPNNINFEIISEK